MPLDFPTSPALNDVYTYNGRSWKWDGTAWNSINSAGAAAAFESGTVMMFAQTAAPTGWTKSTAHNDKTLRVVSGTAGSGGTVAFTTAFASKTPAGSVSVSVSAGTLAVSAGTLAVANTTATGSVSLSGGSVSATTLATTQIPSHNHGSVVSITSVTSNGWPNFVTCANNSFNTTGTTGSAGGGTSHTHAFTAPTGSFTGTAHNHTLSGSPSLSGAPSVSSASFTGTAIDLAVQYVDVIIATKD